MKVSYKTFLKGELAGSSWVFEHDRPDSVWEYKFDKAEFCCDDMRHAFNDKFVFFGEYDGMLNKDNNINIGLCHLYPEGASWDEAAINLCPFCGDSIELMESVRFSKVKTVKVLPEKEKTEYVDVEVHSLTSKAKKND